MKNLPFTWVDLVIFVLLMIGVFRGRKRGMSEELLTFIQWLVIVFVGCRVYEYAGQLLSENAPLSLLTCYLMIYLAFAIFMKLLFSQIQHVVGEKLVGSNFFGDSEYYLGMFAGMIRFACVILMLMALLNARLITDKERAATARMQTKNFEGISFPTFGSIQQAVLFESFAGQQVKAHLDFVLIKSTVSKDVPLRRDDGKAFNEIVGKTSK
ncbi:MAG: CvpA family protein [Verrucomicrobiota bacterium]